MEKQKNNEKTDKDNFAKQGPKKQNPAFLGLPIQKILSLSDKFENDSTYKLLSTDIGVTGGRTISARNKDERIEILVRDVGSIYFYMFSRTHINSVLNLIQDGRKDRIDPQSVEIFDNAVKKHTQISSQNYTAVEFKKMMLGNLDAKIPENIVIPDSGVIKLSDFEKMVGEGAKEISIAREMAKLQPELANVGQILTKEQVLGIYQGGLLNNPEFLQDLYKTHTGGNSINPLKFVAQKDLASLRKRMGDYVDDIVKKAGNNPITEMLLKKMNKLNLMKNGLNLGVGFGISALFLSTFIPKIQYWITQKRTGKNEFPGVKDLKSC